LQYYCVEISKSILLIILDVVLQESPSANAIEEPFLFSKDDEVPYVIIKKFVFNEKIVLSTTVKVAFALYSWGVVGKIEL